MGAHCEVELRGVLFEIDLRVDCVLDLLGDHGVSSRLIAEAVILAGDGSDRSGYLRACPEGIFEKSISFSPAGEA
jgi:hypothetical protein